MQYLGVLVREVFRELRDHAVGFNSLLTDFLAAKEAFSVHKNGSAQGSVSSATWTQITFGTEVYDTGALFAANAWTPTAGLVSLKGGVTITGTIAASDLCGVAVYKNGALYKSAYRGARFNGGESLIAISDRANGTDIYTLWGYVTTTAGDGTFSGVADETWFMGEWLSS